MSKSAKELWEEADALVNLGLDAEERGENDLADYYNKQAAEKYKEADDAARQGN